MEKRGAKTDLDGAVNEFLTYDEYLDSKITPLDLFYLEVIKTNQFCFIFSLLTQQVSFLAFSDAMQLQHQHGAVFLQAGRKSNMVKKNICELLAQYFVFSVGKCCSSWLICN